MGVIRIVRELEACGTATMEHCVRKTTGGGGRGFFSQDIVSPNMQTYTHLYPHTTYLTLTKTHTLTNPQTHTYFPISTQTRKYW